MRLFERGLLVMVLGCVLGAGPAAAAAEPGTIDAFLARQEAASKKAHDKLLVAVERTAKEVERSNLAPGEKQTLLAEIDKDRAALDKSGTLPSSDVLLPAVVGVLEDYQKVLVQLEKFRQNSTSRALRKNDADALAKVADLEARLNKIVGGREYFTSGSAWSGEFAKHGLGRRGKKIVDQAFEMHLTIADVQDNNFSGELRQIGNVGRSTNMDVVGTLAGNKIAFGTGKVTRGKDRAFAFSGYLLSDRIILQAAGNDAAGHPASGWLSLWRNGAGKAQAGRRGKAAKQ